MTFVHEYDAKGNHRLVATYVDSPTQHTGEWATYQSFAFIDIYEHRYMCCTEYLAGDFEADTMYDFFRMYKVETTESQVVEVPHANDW